MLEPAWRADLVRSQIEDMADDLRDLIVWNAPDHEHTRIQVRGWMDAALQEAFDLYEAMGGDASQGLAVPDPQEPQT